MNTISELNKISKKSPRKLRVVTLYNLISFWLTLVFGIAGMLIGIYFLPLDQLELIPVSLIILIPIILIATSYIMLEVNLRLLKGSQKAYWILLIFFALQCVGIGIAGTKFNFDLGGIPITFTFTVDQFFLKINFAAIILTLYLLSFKKELPQLLQTLKERNNNK